MAGVVVIRSLTPVMMKIALRTYDPVTITFLRLPQGVILLALVHLIRLRPWAALFNVTRWHLLDGLAVGCNYLLFSLGWISPLRGPALWSFNLLVLTEQMWFTVPSQRSRDAKIASRFSESGPRKTCPSITSGISSPAKDSDVGVKSISLTNFSPTIPASI